jgi:hypothetical protein
MAVEISGPTPGTLINRWHLASVRLSLTCFVMRGLCRAATGAGKIKGSTQEAVRR